MSKHHTGIRHNTRKMPKITTGIGPNAPKMAFFTTGISHNTRKVATITTCKNVYTGSRKIVFKKKPPILNAISLQHNLTEYSFLKTLITFSSLNQPIDPSIPLTYE
jgi:hypothetical protein